jgi:hypothetical protein
MVNSSEWKVELTDWKEWDILPSRLQGVLQNRNEDGLHELTQDDYDMIIQGPAACLSTKGQKTDGNFSITS